MFTVPSRRRPTRVGVLFGAYTHRLEGFDGLSIDDVITVCGIVTDVDSHRSGSAPARVVDCPYCLGVRSPYEHRL